MKNKLVRVKLALQKYDNFICRLKRVLALYSSIDLYFHVYVSRWCNPYNVLFTCISFNVSPVLPLTFKSPLHILHFCIYFFFIFFCGCMIQNHHFLPTLKQICGSNFFGFKLFKFFFELHSIYLLYMFAFFG